MTSPTSSCRNATAARARGFDPGLKVICGEHPVFVDNFTGHHPMYTSPVPYAGEDDPTVAFLPVIVVGDAAA